MAMLLLTALGLALVLNTSVETLIAGNYRNAQEALYAADAGIERSVQELLTVADWNAILAGNTTSAFVDGPAGGLRTLSDGSVLDLTQATRVANCGKASGCSVTDMNARTDDRPWGLNNPRWNLYAYGPITSLAPTGTVNSSVYLVVWVGDDQSENDNDPTRDGSAQTNPGTGVLALRAEAFGPSGSRRVIEVTVARAGPIADRHAVVGAAGKTEPIGDPTGYNTAVGQRGMRILSWREGR
jgi:hypothetical protein